MSEAALPHVVSVGECMVELAPLAQDATFRLGFAGDTLNTAWYLRRLLPSGRPVSYFTAVGADALSDRMLGFLQQAGIQTGSVQRRSDRTVGLYLIELAEGERSFAYWRGESAARTLADDADRLQSAFTGAAMVYVSGITVAILSPEARGRLLAALQRYRLDGGVVAFDPNLRPLLWHSEAEMRQAIMQAAAAADILLPSFEDEAASFGDADPEATARRYAAAGVGCTVVKNGGAPVLTLSEDILAHHAVTSVGDVVDSTAAGDSFNAGFLAARLDGAALDLAVQAGAALAARVIGGRGALVEAAVTA